PTFYWGNFLIFPEAPAAGDGERWEAIFEREFAQSPGVRHYAFAWDRTDGELGCAESEFRDQRQYILDHVVGLIATPEQLRPHPRENREVEIRPLAHDSDEQAWEQVVELQVETRDEIHEEQAHREFTIARFRDLRALFAAGRGSWYVACDGDEVLASCGVVVTGGRGRFQTVATAEAHRRKGICSRLVVAAGLDGANRFGARRLVIVADPEYHAL